MEQVNSDIHVHGNGMPYCIVAQRAHTHTRGLVATMPTRYIAMKGQIPLAPETQGYLAKLFYGPK